MASSRLRLCFASPSHEQIREGVAVLAEVCRKEFGGRNELRMWRSARGAERSGSTCRTKRYSQRNTSAIRNSRTIETLPLPASIWAT